MQTYKGTCHCGAVTFDFAHEAITGGLRCNCSICRRRGAVMSTFVLSPDELRIHADEGALACYEFGTQTAKHYFCTRCGIYPFHQTLRKPGHYRVNLGCIDDLDTNAMDVRVFDGKNL